MSRRLEVASVLGILALALALRLGGIEFGLDLADPERTQLGSLTDERGMVEAIHDQFLHGSLDPASFLNRGPAGFLLFGAVDAAWLGARGLVDGRGWRGSLHELDVNPSRLHLLHRWISVAAGVASVFLLVFILRREFERASALCAGLLLAVAYLHVRESHFGTVDVLWGATVLLALERMFAWIRAPSRARGFTSGLCAGLSAATKYFSVLLGAHLLVAHLFARRNTAQPGALRDLWWALLAAPLGFFLVSPGVVLAGTQFLHVLDFAAGHYGIAGSGSSLLDNARAHVLYSLGIGLGEPVFVLSLCGLPLLWRRGPSGRFYLLALLFFVPSLLLTSMRPVRYAVPLLALFAGSAGVALAALLARVKPWLRPVLLVLCLAPSLARALSFDRLLCAEDTRVEMMTVLRAHELRAKDVLAVGSHHALPQPSARPDKPFAAYGPRIPGRPGITLAMVRARPPQLILWELSAPDWALPERAELEAFRDANYHEILRLESRLRATELPDPIAGSPSLMVPFARPWDMARPGPPLVLYARNE